MSQTVIGIFKSSSEAQNAVQQLLSNGFTEDNVEISSGNSSTSTGLSSTTGLSGTGDSTESGIGKFFKNLFGTDNDESDRYTRVAERGSVVTVYAKTAAEAETVATLLDQYGAVDVDDQDKQYNATSAANFDTTSGDNQKISIIEENIQVGKKEVQTGGVRLRSRIVETPFSESVRLREEHVRVERKKVDRVATDSDLTNFQEGTIELTESAEVPVVAKEARIVEEVSLGKDVEHREETISDTIRKTEVDVEEIESERKNKNIL